MSAQAGWASAHERAPIEAGTMASDVLALVVVWSAAEPWRAGEVAVIGEEDGELVLGRGTEADRGGQLRLHRQRPGILEERPPIDAPISPNHLVLRAKEGVLDVACRGDLPVRASGGEPARELRVRPGDTIEIEGEMLFLVTERPRALRPQKLGTVDMPFGDPDPYRIIGESPAAWRLRESLARAAMKNEPVLLLGESGTGKEAAASAIHKMSDRAASPFRALNAAAIPEKLVEAELFGNLKDYPQAGMPDRKGFLGDAADGFLFLDEIGEVSQELQAKLMRLFDAYGGTYFRVGGGAPLAAKCRLIVATNRSPRELKFDFAARLTSRVTIPSLRDRREDIPLFVRKVVVRRAERTPQLAAQFVHEIGGRREVRIHPSFMDRLVRHDYKTNFRELQLYLDLAMDQSEGDVLEAPTELVTAERVASSDTSAAADPPPAIAEERTPPTAKEIAPALERHRGNIAATARSFSMDRMTFSRLMARLGIKRPPPSDDPEQA